MEDIQAIAMLEHNPVPTVDTMSRWQRIKARIGLDVYVGDYQLSNWSGPLAFYLYRCRRCGDLEIDYRHGWDGHFYCQRRVQSAKTTGS